MLIQKGEKKINVSPKAFRILYQEQGYKEVMQNAGQEDDIIRSLKKMKVEKLKILAEEKGIEGCEKMRKEDLVEALKDVM